MGREAEMKGTAAATVHRECRQMRVRQAAVSAGIAAAAAAAAVAVVLVAPSTKIESTVRRFVNSKSCVHVQVIVYGCCLYLSPFLFI